MLRPRAYFVQAPGEKPVVFTDQSRALNYGAWKHGQVETMVPESELIELTERIKTLESELKACGRS